MRIAKCQGCQAKCDSSFDRVQVIGGWAHSDCVSTFNLRIPNKRKSAWEKFVDTKSDEDLKTMEIEELHAEFRVKGLHL